MTVHDAELIRGSKGGGKGKGGGGGSNADNTLRSKARARWVEIVSEGPCVGLIDINGRALTEANYGKGVYFEQTPVVNERGTKNFDNVLIQQRLGYPDQEHLNGFTQVETPFQVETQVKKETGPVVRTINEENADAVRVIVRLPALVKQDKKSGKLKTTDVSYSIQVRPFNGTWTTAHTENLEGQKATSAVQRAHRVELPLGGRPWDIRVVRNTEDSDDDTLSNETWFESYTVLVEGKFIYPNTALIAMEVNAEDMGQSVPARYYRYRGLIVSVPSNYDPIKRTYSGVWDGTFKQAWTNNPAWIFYDLLTNDRYGLGEFVTPQIVDKWSLYQIAQYCDAMVKTGFKDPKTKADLMEPRYTFNGVLRSREDAWRVLQQVSTAWRGMAYWSLGQVFATADMPEDPVKLFSPANVVGGEFNYSGTSQKARHTVALVSFNNPDDFYRPDVEPVVHEEGLLRWGWREKPVQLQGCTSRSLAHRYGDWILDVEQNETETVDFTASWDSTDVRPGNIIAIADPAKAQVRIGGRLKAVETSLLYLDGPFKPAAGATYQVYVTLPSGEVKLLDIARFTNEIFENGESLGYDRIALKAPLDTLPLVNSMWVLRGTDVQPRQYRVITIKEDKKNLFKLTALFHDPNKYARVEKMRALDPTTYTRPKNESLPPENLKVREVSYLVNGQPRSSLTLSWSNPRDYLTKQYEVAVLSPDSGYNTIGTTANNSIDITDLSDGEYTFYVYAINYASVRSLPAKLDYEVAGWQVSSLASVKELRLVGGDTDTTFVGTDVSIKWTNAFPASTDATADDAAPSDVRSPFYSFNTVKVYHAQTNVLLREERVYVPAYVYTLAMNTADGKAAGIGPTRNLRFEVSVTDTLSRVSAEALLTVNNPVPAMFLPTVSPNGKNLYLTWSASQELDIRGTLIWISETPGFDPEKTEPVFDGTGSTYAHLGKPSTAYYVRAANYDSFGKTGLNICPEMLVRTLSDFDAEPPAIPTGLVVTSELQADGKAKLIATWNANTEEDFATYDVNIKEGSGNYVSFITSATRYEWTVFPGRTFTVKLRASDRVSNPSGFTTEVVHVSAKDSTPPAVPTGFKASGTFRAVWLEWAANTEADFDFYEVYESDVTAAPVANTEATFKFTNTTVPRDNLPANVTKHYWLRAIDTSGNRSEWTARVSATTLTLDGSVPAPAIPAAPTLSSTIVVENGLTLARISVSWNAVADAVTYEVGIQAGSEAEIFQVSGGHNSFVFDGLPGVVYKVRVRSIGSVYNKSWYSETSSITPVGDTVAPAVPVGFAAKAAFQTVWLEWVANTENDFHHYEIFETASSDVPAGNTPATFSSVNEVFSRSGLAAGAFFTYFIRAVDTSGNKSAWSAPVSATTLTLEGTVPAPAMPTGLVAASEPVTLSDGSTTAKVTVAWVSVPRAAAYELGVKRAGAFETLFTVGGTTFEFDAIPGIAYEIRVRSLNAVSGKSNFTHPVTVRPTGDTVAPAVPTQLKARTGFQTIWLSWSRNAESDFKHYEVFEGETQSTPAGDAKATYLNGGETLTLTGLPDGLTRYYWVRSVDFSGNKSAWSLSAAATTPSLSSTQPAPAKPSNLNASSALVTLPGGANTAKVTATWNASENAASYEIGVKRAGASETIVAVSGLTYEFDAIPGVTYDIRVCAINALSVRSEYTSVFSIKPAGDTTPPAPVTASIASGFESLLLKFSRNTESDFKEYEVYYSASINPPAADTPATFKTTSDTMTLTGLAAGSVLHFWARSVDFSGNRSVWSSRYTGTASGLGTEDFTGLINTTSFAAGLSALGVGEALPQPPFNDKTPKKFYVPSSGRVYNQKADGTGWISETDASLIVGQLKAGQIEAGAIGTEQLAAFSIRAGNLAIGDFTNMADRGWTVGVRDGWDMSDYFGSWYKETTPNHPMTGEWTLQSKGRHPAITNRYTVSENDGYYFDVWVYNTDPARASILVNTIDEKGADLWHLAAYTDVKNQWVRMSGIVKIPAGHTKCLMSLFSDHAAGQGQFTYWARPVMRKATGNVMIENGAVTADKVTTGELITGSAQIRAAIINNAHIIELDAGKLRAGSVVSGSVLVAGSTGQTLGDIQAWATDPAGRINSAATRVDPGRIVVSGATTLADWRHGGDTTTIDGGKVFAGSISTYQLAVLNGPNLIEDSLFRADFDYWDIAPNFPSNAGFTSYLVEAGTSWASPTGRSMALHQTSGSVGGGFFTDVRLRRNEPGLPGWGRNSVPVKVGEWIEAHVGFSFHRCYGELRLEWRDVGGNVIAYSDGGQFTSGDMGNSSNAEQWPRWRVKGQAPNNACSVGIHIRKLDTTAGQTDSYVFIYKPMLCRVGPNTSEITPWSDGAVTRITGNQINTGVIKADHLRTDTAVITGSAQIANAVINTAHISELSATKLQAYSAIASSITVDGTTFGTIRYGSEVGLIDPVNRINSGSTKVDPGRIVISGATTLADWRGTSDTTQINGGKIQTDSIDVRSLRVGNFTNLIDNGWASGSLGSWFPDIVNNFYLEGAGSGQGGGWNLQTEGTNVVSRFTSIEAGEYVGGSVWFYNTTPHRAVYYIQWFNSAKEYIRSDFIDYHDGKNYWVKMGGNIRQAPAGTAFVRAHLHIEGYTPGSYIYWNKPTLYKAYGGELIVEGAIKGRHLTANEAVITGTAQIADAVVTNAKISDLDAAKIQAGSVISNFVRVAGSTGQDLGNIQAWATDPASRINGIFTQIDPGRIVISGSTSLANWRGQTDTTKIFGGSIEANTVSARQMNIGLGSNSFENSDFNAGKTGWRFDNSGPDIYWDVDAKNANVWVPRNQAAVHVWSGANYSSFGNVYQLDKKDGQPKFFPVIPGRRYEMSAFTGTHRCDAWAIISWRNSNGDEIAAAVGAPNGQIKVGGKSIGEYHQTFVIADAPPGAASCIPYIRKGATWSGQGDSHMWATSFFFAEAMEGQKVPSPWNNTGLTIIDGGNIKAGAIDAGHLRTDTAVISGTAQIADGIITNAKIQNLNADKINAGTVLSNFIKIAGSTGQDLGAVQNWATDPASRINGISTQIDPGRILISGGTSLAHWRSGSDTTKIEGGNIAANSISANSMKIGSRGLTVIGFDFRVWNGTLIWDTGYVAYTDDFGNNKTVTVAAGSVGWGGWTGVYFLKDYGASLHIRNDSNGGWHNLANNPDCVLFCTWWGGFNIAANYGGTYVDGARITTGSITATQIGAGQVQAVQISSDAIEVRHIKAGVIRADRIEIGGVSYDNLAARATGYVGAASNTDAWSGTTLPTAYTVKTQGGVYKNATDVIIVLGDVRVRCTDLAGQQYAMVQFRIREYENGAYTRDLAIQNQYFFETGETQSIMGQGVRIGGVGNYTYAIEIKRTRSDQQFTVGVATITPWVMTKAA